MDSDFVPALYSLGYVFLKQATANQPSLLGKVGRCCPRLAWHFILGGFFRFFSVGPHEFCPRKNVTLHGLGELIVSCPGREPDFGIQRKEPDIIAVSTRRGTRAHVTDLTTII